MRALLFILVSLGGGLVFANVTPATNDIADINQCDKDAITTIQLQSCGEAKYAYYDAMLNAQYNKLSALLADDDKPVLADAERAWIDFRNKECLFKSLENKGGSIQPLTSINCYSELSQQRSQALQAYIIFYQGDKK